MSWRERVHERMQRRQKPPWWPADEQWPPGPGRWSGRRHFPALFLVRVGCLGALVFTLIFATLAGVFWLVARALGITSIPPGRVVLVVPLAVVTLMLVAGGIAWIVRSLRASLRPMNDLLDAAQRVADGD